MKELKESEIKEMKGSFKGKWKLYQLGLKKFKEDPPLYRIHLMQGLATKFTIYMIIFASIYAISVGLWIFALIILPIGTIGNYYAAKSHFMKYKDAVKQYEYAGILKPIEEDISPLRRRWRIIEKQIGFLGIDLMFLLFTGIMTYAYFSDFNLWYKLGISFTGVIVLVILYFTIIYQICLRYYKK